MRPLIHSISLGAGVRCCCSTVLLLIMAHICGLLTLLFLPSNQMRTGLADEEHKPQNVALSIQARALSIASVYSSNDVRPKALTNEATTSRKWTTVPRISETNRVVPQKETEIQKQIDSNTLIRRTCKLSGPYASATPIVGNSDIDSVLSVTLNMLNSVSGLKNSPLLRHMILPNLCQSHRTDLLFVVLTSPIDFIVRNRIRQTWASLHYFHFEGMTKDSGKILGVIDYFFVVPFSNPVNVSLQQLDLIKAEIFRERDILPVLLKDIQGNSVILHMLTSEYLLNTCQNKANYIAFLDKNLIPNIPLLGSFVAAQTPTSNDHTLEPMYCFSVTDAQPVRPKRNQVKRSAESVSLAEWPRPRYPPHCNIELGGFVISLSSLRMWYTCARYYRLFKLPHIHLTGILTEAAGIPVRSYWTTYGQAIRLLPSVGSNSEAGRHLFFTHSTRQPTWVWRNVFQTTLAEALR